MYHISDEKREKNKLTQDFGEREGMPAMPAGTEHEALNDDAQRAESALREALKRRREAAEEVARLASDVVADGSTRESSSCCDAGTLANELRQLANEESALEGALLAEQGARATERALKRGGSEAADKLAGVLENASPAFHHGAGRIRRAVKERLLRIGEKVEEAAGSEVDALLEKAGWPPKQAGSGANAWEPNSAASLEEVHQAFSAFAALAHAFGNVPMSDSSSSWRPHNNFAAKRAAALTGERMAAHFAPGSDLARLDKPEWLAAQALRIARDQATSLEAHLHGIPGISGAFTAEMAVWTRRTLERSYCPGIYALGAKEARPYWIKLAEEFSGFCRRLEEGGRAPSPRPPEGGGPLAALCTRVEWERAWHDAEFGDATRLLDSLPESDWSVDQRSEEPPLAGRHACASIASAAVPRVEELEPDAGGRYLFRVTAAVAKDFLGRCKRRAQAAEWRGSLASEGACARAAAACDAAQHLADGLEDTLLEPSVAAAAATRDGDNALEGVARELREFALSWAERIGHAGASHAVISSCFTRNLASVALRAAA